MAITEWYTGDGGSDAAAGTSHATRWLTIQKALDTMTTGQPNRLNIRGLTTAEAGWDFSTYGIPVNGDNGLIFQGYDTVAGDGTVAAIAGGGSEFITGDTLDFLMFRDLKFTDWGTDTAFSLDNNNFFLNCEFAGEGVRTKCIDMDAANTIHSCTFHGIALTGTLLNGQNTNCFNNYFQIDSGANNSVVLSLAASSIIIGNIISLKTTNNTKGINLLNSFQYVTGNTIFNQSAGTGQGVYISQGVSANSRIYNNVICGMGVGIEAIATSSIAMLGENLYWNNTSTETIAVDVFFPLTSATTLAGNPFTSTGNADHNDDDFTLTSSYRAASYPAFPKEMYDPDDKQAGRNQNTQDVGALQSTPSGGGAGDTIVVKQNVRY